MNTIKFAPLILVFAEVAKQQSFTGAAKKLASSKSAISQQIKRLENELGVQLLVRNTRGIVLTQVGEILLSRSELLNEQMENALADVQKVKNQPKGRFRVAVPPFFEQGIVIPALSQFCLEFPLIEPELVVTGKWQDLIKHELDACIFGGTLRDSSYKAQSIGRVTDIFCTTANYLQLNGKPDTLIDLERHRYIGSAWHKDTIKLMDKQNKTEKQLNLSHCVLTNSLSTLVDMTLADMGITLVPGFVAKPLISRGRLVQVLPNYHGLPWHFYFLHRYHSNKPVYLERFYQLIKNHFVLLINGK